VSPQSAARRSKAPGHQALCERILSPACSSRSLWSLERLVSDEAAHATSSASSPSYRQSGPRAVAKRSGPVRNSEKGGRGGFISDG
jgi:hypothetical protein